MALSIRGRGSPSQAATEHLRDVEALAHRIGTSTSRLIILLEHHGMEMPDQLLEGSSREILRGEKINRFYSEAIDEQEYQQTPLKVRRMWNTAHLQRLQKQNLPDFSFYPIGAHSVSYEESLPQFREEHPHKTLVDAFMIKVARGRLGLKPTDKVAESYLFATADDIYDSFNSGSFEENELAASDHFLKHPVNQNILHAKLKSGLEYQSLRDGLLDEWTNFLDHLLTQRQYGKADEYSVRNIRRTLGPSDRAVIKFGIRHGIIDNNPASLPDQLNKQLREAGHADISMETILLADRKTSGPIHESVKDLLVAGNLRTNVVVYDYELRREWPILEWHKEAPQVYGWVVMSSNQILRPSL